MTKTEIPTRVINAASPNEALAMARAVLAAASSESLAKDKEYCLRIEIFDVEIIDICVGPRPV